MKRIGVIFPGYGEQFVGMCKSIYDNSRLMQDYFERAAACTAINFSQLLFASSTARIFESNESYAAIFLLEAALFSMLKNTNLSIDFIAGYGTGEFSAAFASGSLSFEDGLYIINKLSKIYFEFIKTNKFAILRIPKVKNSNYIEQLCEDFSTANEKLFISSQNSQFCFDIVGNYELMKKFYYALKAEKVRKIKKLPLGYGLHSNLLAPIFEVYAQYFKKIDFKNLEIPVITAVDGVYVTAPDSLEAALLRQFNSKLCWYETLQGFIGCDVLLIIGAGKNIKQWINEMYPEKKVYELLNISDFEKINKSFNLKNDIEKNDIEKCNLNDLDLTDKDAINDLESDYDFYDETAFEADEENEADIFELDNKFDTDKKLKDKNKE